MEKEIQEYNDSQEPSEKEICDLLERIISSNLKFSENKIWHKHPVWFIDGNPIVGYSKLKSGVRLMFWSGIDFDEEQLDPGSGKFKDASITYTSTNEVHEEDLRRWLKKSENIQWDYKNIVKRKGQLVKLK